MGLWLGALGRLKILPEPDNDLIKEFVYFCNHTCPDGYSEDEICAGKKLPWGGVIR